MRPLHLQQLQAQRNPPPRKVPRLQLVRQHRRQPLRRRLNLSQQHLVPKQLLNQLHHQLPRQHQQTMELSESLMAI